MERSFSNEEDEIFLKASFKGDIVPCTNPYYEQLFRMSGCLMEENNKLRECILSLKESLRYLKGTNNSFKIEIKKLKSFKEKCKQCDSLIKEVTRFRETLRKLTQGK